MNFFLKLCLWCGSFIVCAESILFTAEYDVYWRGWYCGIMRSQLKQLDNHQFYYDQEIHSSLFFYPFHQREESVFLLKDKKIIPITYSFYKKETQKPIESYTIKFNRDAIELCQSESFSLFDASPNHYDKLSLQLELIQQIRHQQHDFISLSYVDQRGVHERQYTIGTDSQNALFLTSINNNRTSMFVLDPEQGFFPIAFEQKNNDKPFIRGVVKNVQLHDSWFSFHRE
jgi:hypothetical protein